MTRISTSRSVAHGMLEVPSHAETPLPPARAPGGHAERSAADALPAHCGPDRAQIEKFAAMQRQGGKREGFGVLDVQALEQKVGSRADLDQPLPMQGSTANERASNLTRLVQLDGRGDTTLDRVSCGTMCLVAGLYARDPRGLAKLAAHERGVLQGELGDVAKETKIPAKDIEAALSSLASGHATPRALSTLAQVLLYEAIVRMPTTNVSTCESITPRGGGDSREERVDECSRSLLASAPDIRSTGARGLDLQELVQSVFVRGAKIEAPNLRMELRSVDVEVTRDGKVQKEQLGHWVAELDMQSTDPRTGASTPYVLTYDPWPNDAGGRADLGMADKHQVETRELHRGSRKNEYGIQAGGTFVPIRG